MREINNNFHLHFFDHDEMVDYEMVDYEMMMVDYEMMMVLLLEVRDEIKERKYQFLKC